MSDKLDDFVRNRGRTAAEAAVESFKSQVSDFDQSFVIPMFYASGVTAARLAKEMSSEWIAPLKRQARFAAISATVALAAVATTMFYAWSLVSFTSFAQFLAAFAPAVAALLFTTAKSYKTWAEARKHLAEAQAIASSAPAARQPIN